MSEVAFEMPVPHVYDDGSVAYLSIHKYDDHDHISIRDENQSIVIASPEHARQIARVLLIAADKWSK